MVLLVCAGVSAMLHLVRESPSTYLLLGIRYRQPSDYTHSLQARYNERGDMEARRPDSAVEWARVKYLDQNSIRLSE